MCAATVHGITNYDPRRTAANHGAVFTRCRPEARTCAIVHCSVFTNWNADMFRLPICFACLVSFCVLWLELGLGSGYEYVRLALSAAVWLVSLSVLHTRRHCIQALPYCYCGCYNVNTGVLRAHNQLCRQRHLWGYRSRTRTLTRTTKRRECPYVFLFPFQL